MVYSTSLLIIIEERWNCWMAGKSNKTNTKITENIDLVKRNEELERELEELKKKLETLMSEKVCCGEK